MPDFPISAEKAEVVEGTLINHQVLPKLSIVFDMLGNGELKVGEQSFKLGKGKVLCKQRSVLGPKNAQQCTVIVKISADETPIRLSLDEGTTVYGFSWKVVKFRHKTTLSNAMAGENALLFVPLGLLALLVFCVVTHRNQSLSQWGLIVASGAFLAYNDIRFAGILLGFLWLMHKLHVHLYGGSNRIMKLLGFVIPAMGFLLLFKYGKEGIYSVFANPGQFNLLMPLGVSYFIIRLIDTQLRWFRGQHMDVSFREFLCFIIFPGTLVAGPIEDINSFYKNRLTAIGRNDYAYGVGRILLGVFKKIVIADGLLYQVLSSLGFNKWFGGMRGYSLVDSLIVDPSGASPLEIMTFALAGLLFAYIDFSAYSDMAIGASRLMGYRIRENFNFPVLAVNIREYWKRWHMSLSNWAFQNIYFPLMVKTRNSHIPLFVTMLTIGLWHAFNLSWFFWAMHHGAGIAVVALMQKYVPVSQAVLYWLRPVRTALTVLFASLGFIFVYFNDYAIASELYLGVWRGLFWPIF